MESRTLGFSSQHAHQAAIRQLKVPRCSTAPASQCQVSRNARKRHVSRSAPERSTNAAESSNSRPKEDDWSEDLTRDYRSNDVDAEYERRQSNALRERISWRAGLNFKPESLNSARRSESFGESVQAVLDKVLIADFFFVCLALFLLIVGLGERVTMKTSNIIDLWLPAWPLVVQPAIGLLMAGALASGLAGWYRSDIAKDR